MSPTKEAIEAAAPELFAAVSHLLRRIGEDPAGVGYHAGLATQVFESAVRAYAKATGRDEDDVRTEILDTQDANDKPEEELRMLRRRIESLEVSR
jgi:hypothetical protein